MNQELFGSRELDRECPCHLVRGRVLLGRLLLESPEVQLLTSLAVNCRRRLPTADRPRTQCAPIAATSAYSAAQADSQKAQTRPAFAFLRGLVVPAALLLLANHVLSQQGNYSPARLCFICLCATNLTPLYWYRNAAGRAILLANSLANVAAQEEVQFHSC